MISTFEVLRLFERVKPNQCLSDLIFMVDFISAGLPVILNKDGSVMTVFEIQGIGYEGLEPEEIDDIEREIAVFAELVKENITITHYFIRRRGERLHLNCELQAPGLVKTLQQRKEDFYNGLEGETFSSSILCLLKLNGPLIKKSDMNFFLGANREFLLLKDKIFENVEKLLEISRLAKTGLSRINIRELPLPEIFAHFFYLINGPKPVPVYRPDLSLNSQLARSFYRFDRDFFRVDEGFRRVIGLIDEPPSTDRMFFKGFLDYRGEIVIKNSFTTVDYDKLKRTLASNYKISKALLFKKTLSGEYLSEYEENELLVEKERKKPFYHNLGIMVAATSREELDRLTDDLVVRVCKTGAYADRERKYLPTAAVSFFPGQEQFNRRQKYILSNNLSNLFIKGKLSAGDGQPLEYFLDRNGGFYGFNPFSRGDAPHIIITGSTGKGKSYLLIKILLSFLAIDCRIVAIDRSLDFFFEVLREMDPDNTAIMKLGADRVDLRFNPFWVAPENDDPVSEEQMGLCEGLLTIMLGKNLEPGGRYLVRDSLEQFFEEYREALRHSSQTVKPLDVLVTIIKDRFRDKKVENAVRLWMEGDRGEILNSGQDNLQDKKYCLFDLKGLEEREDMLRLVSYLLFNRIERLVTDEKSLAVPKILAIDEAKYYYGREELAPLLDKYIRQGRKYNLCLIQNFQSINDALLTDEQGNLAGWARGLLENTQKFILFARQVKIESALSALRLSVFQRELYEGLDTAKREFMLVGKNGSVRVLNPVTDPWVNAIATSHPRESHFREALRRECGGSFLKAIERFVDIAGISPDIGERVKRLEKYFAGGN